MRALASIALGLLLMSGSAQAQNHFVGQKPNPHGTGFNPPAGSASASRPDYGVGLPEPYRPYTARAAPKAPGLTDGGEAFKPYSGTSVYSNRGGVDAYGKPAKPKHTTYGF